MIDYKELRMGNWVMEPLGDYMKVEIIGHPDKPDYIFARGNGGFGQNAFEPISISPEILGKCGFEKKDRSNEYWDFWMLDNGWYIGMAHHNEPSAGVKKDGYYWGENYVPVKYLHQLQNLYFALTGTELNINFDLTNDK